MNVTFAAVMEVIALALVVVAGWASLLGISHADTTVLWVIAIYFHLRRRELQSAASLLSTPDGAA